MLRSLAPSSLRSCLGLSKSTLLRHVLRIAANPVPRWRSGITRTYCSNTNKPAIQTVDSASVIRNVPHTVIDADADLQIDLANELKLQLPITNEPRKYIEFDCAVCNTRVKKTCSTHSYEKGILSLN